MIKLKTFLLRIESPLTFLLTYDVTHSRVVTHFRSLKNSKNKNFNFLKYCTNHKSAILNMWNKLDICNHIFIFLNEETTLKIKKNYLFFLTLKLL